MAASSPRAAARSGNPATRAAAPKPRASRAKTTPPPMPEPVVEPGMRSTASSWKKSVAVEAVDVELPSGNVALLRRVSPETFIAQKMIPDSISPMIQEAIDSKKGLAPKKQQEMLNNPDAIADAVKFMNAALVYAVVDPKILPVPDDPHAERDPEGLYADEVDLQDKMFVFNWASGGSSDLARFRSEFGDAVARLDVGEDLALPSV